LGDRLVADGVEEVQLGVVEEGTGLLVGGVAGAQLPDLLLPPLHLLLVDPADGTRSASDEGGAASSEENGGR